MPLFIVIVLVIVLVGVVLLAWMKPKFRKMAAQEEAFFERYRQREQEIAALPFEEARHQAELLLSDPKVFECVLAHSPPTASFDSLAVHLQSLFSRFVSIQAAESEAFLSREFIAPFGWGWEDGPWRREQFWQIGTNHEYVVILVKPHQEGIYETDGIDDDLTEPDYPSIYHWLLMVTSDFSS